MAKFPLLLWTEGWVEESAATFSALLWPGRWFEWHMATFPALLWPEREARVVRLVGSTAGSQYAARPLRDASAGGSVERPSSPRPVAAGKFRVHRRDYARERGRLRRRAGASRDFVEIEAAEAPAVASAICRIPPWGMSRSDRGVIRCSTKRSGDCRTLSERSDKAPHPRRGAWGEGNVTCSTKQKGPATAEPFRSEATKPLTRGEGFGERVT